jgi:serine/threonine-protein kinase
MTTRIACLVTAVLCFAAAAPAVAQTSGAPHWRTYQNDRYGTTIDYPDPFKAEPPPDNDDGRRFKSGDGAEFAVFASYNAFDFDLAGYQKYILDKLGPGKAVTYRAHGEDWFVISGTEGDGIFYERYMLSHGKEMTEGFVMSYPAALKETYDPIVARMAKSFRSGTGFQTPGADIRNGR